MDDNFKFSVRMMADGAVPRLGPWGLALGLAPGWRPALRGRGLPQWRPY
jgi:hypothetical protein